MGAILSLGFEGVPACGAPLWTLNVLWDFLLHCCIGAEQSACAGFLSFVLSPHSKYFPVLLSCSASCKFNWVFHFFEIFWDSEILLACVSSSFMWLSFKMTFAGPLWIQFYCVATAYLCFLGKFEEKHNHECVISVVIKAGLWGQQSTASFFHQYCQHLFSFWHV